MPNNVHSTFRTFLISEIDGKLRLCVSNKLQHGMNNVANLGHHSNKINASNENYKKTEHDPAKVG